MRSKKESRVNGETEALLHDLMATPVDRRWILKAGLGSAAALGASRLAWGSAPAVAADVTGSAPTWQNWTGNIKRLPPGDGEAYYFTPTNLSELREVVADARQKQVSIRVSGQRHSQPPLVADDNRNNPTPKPEYYLVDMSCYVLLMSEIVRSEDGFHAAASVR
jgi:hypothetical protein